MVESKRSLPILNINEFYVKDLKFFKADGWLTYFGDVMVKWPYRTKSTMVSNWITRLVLFKKGFIIDFQITALKTVDFCRYRNGFKVLMDKDGLANNLPEPRFDTYIIKKPDAKALEILVNEFWWNVYYVPKY